jgi:uncharacterized protein YozE (UPF0346 family)
MIKVGFIRYLMTKKNPERIQDFSKVRNELISLNQ